MEMEKVIKGLENCITGFDCPPECPYLDDCNDLMKPMFVELAKDALALLKEQEATTFKPHYIDEYGKHFICGVECGACHKEISSTYHYCPWCGRQVKWE